MTTELTKAQKWKQHADAEAAIARHWKARHKAKAEVDKSFHGRWHPKLQAILLPLEGEVRDELSDELITGKAPDG